MIHRTAHLFLSVSISLITALGFRFQIALAQEGERISFAPLTEDEVDRFRDSLKNHVPLVSYSPRPTQTPPKNVELAWSGISSDVVTSVGDIILRFKPNKEAVLSRSVTSADASAALLDHFELTLSANQSGVRFIHSSPQNSEEASGFKASLKTEAPRTRTKMIYGQRDSSMYVAIPPYHNVDEMWGLFICPRLVNDATTSGAGSRTIALERSPYDLAEVFLSFEGKGTTTFESIRGKVRAAIMLQLSSGLPESVKYSDSVVSTMADPRVRYAPVTPFRYSPFPSSNTMQEGINIMVEQQNRGGYIRRQNISHVVSILKSSEFSPVAVTVKGIQPNADLGDCYIVQAQRYSWKEYDQSPVNF